MVFEEQRHLKGHIWGSEIGWKSRNKIGDVRRRGGIKVQW